MYSNDMKRILYLPLLLALLCAAPLRAQHADPQTSAAAGERTLSADSITTGDAHMDSLYRSLPEVMVTGERPVVKARAGRLEYDLPRIIENKPVDNIYDALKQLPGVAEMNDGLSLGARGVTIVLDGKVTNMTTEQLYALLKSMPASRIERVDVMYNAPARYQVRGAMIDVRLRHRIGDPGTVQGEVYGQYNHQHEASFQERASLLYNGRRLSLDFLYSHNHGKGYNTTHKEARHWQEATDETILVENFETGRSRSHTHSFRLGSDYRIGDRHALSFVYNGTYSTSHYNQHTTGTQTATNLSGSTSWLHNGRLDYEAPIGLKAGAEFTWYRTPGHQQLTSEMEGTHLDFYTKDMQRINAWKFYLSQEHELKNGWGLNYGAIYTTSVDNSYQRYYDNEERGMKNEELAGELPPDMTSRRREQTLNVSFSMENDAKVYIRCVYFCDECEVTGIEMRDYAEMRVGETYRIQPAYALLSNGVKLYADIKAEFNGAPVEGSVITFESEGELVITYTVERPYLEEALMKTCIVRVTE